MKIRIIPTSCFMVHNGLQLGDGGHSEPISSNLLLTSSRYDFHNYSKLPAVSKVMCVPSMGIRYRRYQIIPEGEKSVPMPIGIPYAGELLP